MVKRWFSKPNLWVQVPFFLLIYKNKIFLVQQIHFIKKKNSFFFKVKLVTTINTLLNYFLCIQFLVIGASVGFFYNLCKLND